MWEKRSKKKKAEMKKERSPLFKALNPEQKALTNKTDKIYLP